ncbi:hypothetical protein [Robertkochia aurantiaca]|uniref:hypothetical protein n=1 Tax=Robertkochia aurantiaca TaxID=2873700 RepID=UPI001CCC5509|nr:hypothetical protein [Robertkochia sp. 3YJGBD-33]
MMKALPEILAEGGSLIASPDGEWLMPRLRNDQKLITAELTIRKVIEERQNFDPSGHNSRPDEIQLSVNNSRQSILKKLKY